MPTGFAFAFLASTLLTTHSGGPSAADILNRCHRAYDSTKSFEEDVQSVAGTLKASVHISFVRPGRFRATGKSTAGSKFVMKYDLLVLGMSVSVFNNNKWQPASSPEMGLSMVTGIGGTAPTAVGSLLLHTGWGALRPDKEVHYKVSQEIAGGRDCFRLQPQGNTGMSIWIDKSNYFLIKTHLPVYQSAIDVQYAPPKINQLMPSNRFSR